MLRMMKYVFSLILICSCLSFAIGKYLTHSANRDIGIPPTDLPIKKVTFSDKFGKNVSAWLIEGAFDKGGVLLFHGIRADRRFMINRARLLFDHGYSVLLVDLQAHGESQGVRITFGYLESFSVVAAIKYACAIWPQKGLGVIGTSLGGASAVFATKSIKVDAYILEAVFSTLRHATENRLRLRFGKLGVFLSHFLLWQTQLQLGFHVDELSPLGQISKISAPLLLIAGEKDQRTTLENSYALYEEALNPKSIWIVPKAKHQDFQKFVPEIYKKQVLKFLEKNLNK